MAPMTMSARLAPTRADDVGERVSVLRLFLSGHEVVGVGGLTDRHVTRRFPR